jgi:acetyltransferase EpsM
MREDVIIVGAGEHGAVVADVIQCEGRYRVHGFVDDNPDRTGSQVLHHPVLGTIQDLKQQYPEYLLIMAIGHDATRLRIAGELEAVGFTFISTVHPSATVSPEAEVEPGTAVMPQAVINTRARVEGHCIINSGAMVEHDCHVAAGCHISVGAILAGRVSVGTCSLIGAGVTVLPHLSIGAHAVVGAGAVVTGDLPDRVVAKGIPARIDPAIT